ncbi:hypothetical protein [Desulfuromonas thiophila]|uniref:hypothetical protein n=1 Tax=Desulfuromonas thiophila TaxID=57664 RepID=UPI0024A95EFA|nr:hypothetical protein [Desulfuromonas thiophila]
MDAATRISWVDPARDDGLNLVNAGRLRPLATVVIGGVLTSTPLNLFVLPALYLAVNRKQPEQRS